MALSNQPLEAPFCAFLENVIADDARHGRFLNTLSLLEHIGSRKIMLSHAHTPPGGEVLKHMAEEARHAYFFSHQAERFLKQPSHGYADTNTLAPAAAKTYFAKLDSAIEQALGQRRAGDACYLWVSLIIELRANWAFDFYQRALVQAKKSLSLKSILAEENLHLEDMFESASATTPDAANLLPILCKKEQMLFEHFFKQLQGAIT